MLAVLGLLLFSGTASATDNWPGTLISGSGTLTGNNTGMTSQAGEPLSLGGGALNTLWYRWVAPVTGTVSFGTCNPTGSTLTDFDTTIGVYTGAAVNALTQVAFNDDTPGCNSVVQPNYGSTVIFSATAGTTYYIQIDGYANTVGNFQFFYGYSGFTTNLTDANATEAAGNTGAFTVVLNAVPTGTVTVAIGTSTQCTFSPTTLTFTSANWNVAQTVTATPIDDAVAEGTHFCAPSAITPSGGGVVGSSAPPPGVTITDNDTATLTIANTTNGAETGPVSGVMTITQAAISATNTVINLTITGTATSGADYTALATTATIAAGTTTTTITIPVINDAIVEGNETVIVTMSSVASGVGVIGSPSAATNTIADNDSATVSIAATTNGNEAGPVSVVFTVTQTAVSSTATVINLTRSGTSTLTSDYTSPSNTITIAAGATTATITYPVVNDVAVEGDETLIVTMSSIASGLATLGSPAAATATIFDNDAPTVNIANTTDGTEVGPTGGLMTLTMSATRTTPVTIAYTVSGTATSGVDFTALSGSATIATGALTTTIPITVLQDTIVEAGETVVVTLTSVTSGAATIGTTVIATNTIADNDSATVTIANTTNGAEAGPVNGVLTVTQSAASTANSVISYSVSGTATSGTDYTALSGTVTILAGDLTATISIPVLDDVALDPAETVTITLNGVSSSLAVSLGATLIATNTIADNEVPNPVLVIDKRASTPGPVSVGNIITYTYDVTNNGNNVITGITINDVHNGSGTLGAIAGEVLLTDAVPTNDSSDTGGQNGNWATLAPGDTVRFTASYTVMQADIDNLQ